MQRVPLLMAALLAVSCGSQTPSPSRSAQPNTPSASARPTPDRETPVANGRPDLISLEHGEAVTEEMRTLNSDDYADPPNQFRTGHTTPRALPKEALSTTKGGFSIQLPSKAPIVTPAVYDGMVITSGGFHSKEIYAFDAKSGALEWGLNLDDDGPSAPACEDDVCVFNTESCTVFAVEAKSGELLWSWWLGDPLMSAPTIANGMVYTAFPAQGNTNGVRAQQQHATSAPRPPGMSHALGAFDLQTGEMKWSLWIDADVMSAPVATRDALFVTTFAGTVMKLDPTDGSILQARRDRATSAPVIADGSLYYSRRDDGDDGVNEALVRSSATKGSYVTARKKADYLDEKVQSKSKMAERGRSLDASNGFSGGAPASANAQTANALVGQASVSTLQAFQGSRALNFRGLNVNSMGDEVVCTRADSGEELWRLQLDGDLANSGGFLAAPPVAAGGQLFVATLQGEVLQLDPDSGKVAKRHRVGRAVRSQPVVENGWLYVGTDDGQLVALRLGDDRFTGWSHWGGNAARTGVAR